MICNRNHLKRFFLVVGMIVGLCILIFLVFDIEEHVYGSLRGLAVMHRERDLRQDVIFDVIRYFNPYLTEKQQQLICETILSQASNADLEPFLVASVIAAESSFRPQALSHCAARGLMQITDTVAMMMRIDNPYDITQNITAGTRYLKGLRQRFAEDELVLAAYNAGPTRVARLGRVPRIRETVDYIEKVARFRVRLQQDLYDRIERLMVGISFSNSLAVSQSAIMTESAPEGLAYLHQTHLERLGEKDGCEPGRRGLFLLQA